ncbi:DUF1661 domain-containing protein [Porphyromonas gulae]|uniref:DUF1661 domain-containing protein n=1 Tax=Porphyromonas gulae TaxID=111105 RepID=UPI000AF916BC|nr:DUF1661 domain-containing protein [Porphyromonas gulae]
MRKFFSSRAKTKKFTNHVFTNHKQEEKNSRNRDRRFSRYRFSFRSVVSTCLYMVHIAGLKHFYLIFVRISEKQSEEKAKEEKLWQE